MKTSLIERSLSFDAKAARENAIALRTLQSIADAINQRPVEIKIYRSKDEPIIHDPGCSTNKRDCRHCRQILTETQTNA